MSQSQYPVLMLMLLLDIGVIEVETEELRDPSRLMEAPDKAGEWRQSILQEYVVQGDGRL